MHDSQESSPELDNGESFLTNHQLAWINTLKSHWISIPLQNILKIETTVVIIHFVLKFNKSWDSFQLLHLK